MCKKSESLQARRPSIRRGVRQIHRPDWPTCADCDGVPGARGGVKADAVRVAVEMTVQWVSACHVAAQARRMYTAEGEPLGGGGRVPLGRTVWVQCAGAGPGPGPGPGPEDVDRFGYTNRGVLPKAKTATRRRARGVACWRQPRRFGKLPSFPPLFFALARVSHPSGDCSKTPVTLGGRCVSHVNTTTALRTGASTDQASAYPPSWAWCDLCTLDTCTHTDTHTHTHSVGGWAPLHRHEAPFPACALVLGHLLRKVDRHRPPSPQPPPRPHSAQKPQRYPAKREFHTGHPPLARPSHVPRHHLITVLSRAGSGAARATQQHARQRAMPDGNSESNHVKTRHAGDLQTFLQSLDLLPHHSLARSYRIVSPAFLPSSQICRSYRPGQASRSTRIHIVNPGLILCWDPPVGGARAECRRKNCNSTGSTQTPFHSGIFSSENEDCHRPAAQTPSTPEIAVKFVLEPFSACPVSSGLHSQSIIHSHPLIVESV